VTYTQSPGEKQQSFKAKKLYQHLKESLLRTDIVPGSTEPASIFELFSAPIISPSTTYLYERNLIRFLKKRINLSPDPRVQFANHNPSAAEKKIISHISQDRFKIKRGEIRKKLPQAMMHRIHTVRRSERPIILVYCRSNEDNRPWIYTKEKKI